jgi:hypothetical protein
MTITLTREEAQQDNYKKSLWRKRSDKRREELPPQNK